MSLRGRAGRFRGSVVREVVTCAVLVGASAAGAQAIDAVPGFPEGNQPITLEFAVRRAVGWHPSVAEAIGRLKASDEEVSVAKSGYRPRINAGVASGYDNTNGSGWRPRASVSASQMLFDFGKVSSSVDLAEAETRVSHAQVLQAVDLLVRDTSYAVIELQRSVALRRVALQQLSVVQEIGDLVDYRYRRGAATKSDALQSKARVQGAVAAIEEIEAEQRRWASNLAYLLGRDKMLEASPDVPGWLLDACSHSDPDWDRIPAMMEVKAAREQAEAGLRRARADGMPTISLGAGTSAEIADPTSDRAQYNVGINVSSALYGGGAYRARTRGAGYALSAADAAEARVRNEVGRLIAEGNRQVDNFRNVIATLQLREASTEETGKLYRLQYLEMGTRTLVDLLNSQQELQQVRFDLVNTTHDLRRLNVDCLYNSGAPRDAFRLSGMVVEGVRL